MSEAAESTGSEATEVSADAATRASEKPGCALVRRRTPSPA